ncbi:unnamed protein product [Euphydryas editha]|uniref:Uncharacterized protein n=1 Tax=Euphydryas editha TaxID=104508 RepID=A0AAU9U3Z9_EUPED|nr:unnamed protein product [Euphydryas editha]
MVPTSAIHSAQCHVPSGVTTKIMPSRVQHLLMPKRYIVTRNVKNSELLKPVPVNLILTYQILSRTAESLKRTTTGRGFLSDRRPNRYEVLMLVLEKSAKLRCPATILVTRADGSLALSSGTPYVIM